jgi:hypothetical protein
VIDGNSKPQADPAGNRQPMTGAVSSHHSIRLIIGHEANLILPEKIATIARANIILPACHFVILVTNPDGL